MRNLLTFIFILFLALTGCSKTDVSGTWTGEISVNGRSMNIDCNLTQTEKAVDGFLVFKDFAQQMPISGTILENKISLSTPVADGAYFNFSGTISENSIISGTTAMTTVSNEGDIANDDGDFKLTRK